MPAPNAGQPQGVAPTYRDVRVCKMLRINIPGRGEYELEHLVLDYNGTIALDGELLPGVADRIVNLSKHLHIHVLTADTFGTVRKSLSRLPCTVSVIKAGDREDLEKLDYLRRLNPDNCVAIGNGANDRLMLSHAAIGICVIQQEGSAFDAIKSADVVCNSVIDALDLLVYPSRLIATLRGCPLD